MAEPAVNVTAFCTNCRKNDPVRAHTLLNPDVRYQHHRLAKLDETLRIQELVESILAGKPAQQLKCSLKPGLGQRV